MDIDVMQYMAQAIRGDVAGVAETSFDCISCGLCASRCPAEEAQYHVATLCRRLHAAHGVPRSKHLRAAVKAVEEGRWEEPLAELMDLDEEELKQLYRDRESEPDNAPDDWTPEDTRYVLDPEEAARSGGK
jgi:ferredoxin